MPDTIIYWLWGLVKAIPEDIIKGLIASFLILLIVKLVNKMEKCKIYRHKLGGQPILMIKA